MWSKCIVAMLALLPFVWSTILDEQKSCSPDFKICSPQGAETFALGSFNSSWDNLFNDIVNVISGFSLNSPTATTIDPNGPARRDLSQGVGFCCSVIADCLLVPGYRIPMCWDRFTTNVYFPDGTYGTVVTGVFNKTNGDTINLVYGNYVLTDGQTGNIYSGQNASSMQPKTATMPMPKPWTSTGQGSAIPATGLGLTGLLTTGASVIPGTTQAPITDGPLTILASPTDCNHCPSYNTVISGPTQSGTIRSASISAYTSVIIQPTPPSQAPHGHVEVITTIVSIILIAVVLSCCI